MAKPPTLFLTDNLRVSAAGGAAISDEIPSLNRCFSYHHQLRCFEHVGVVVVVRAPSFLIN